MNKINHEERKIVIFLGSNEVLVATKERLLERLLGRHGRGLAR